MSSSYDVSTAYDALDDSVYDLFDLDAYCSSLSPPNSTPEPVPNATTPTSWAKRYPKTRGHPRPSPAVLPSPAVSLVSTPAVASTSSFPITVSAKPDKGKVVNTQPLPHPPPVLWTPRHLSPPLPSSSLQNSTSALCGCLSISMSGSHKDGNQGSTNRVYGLWLKSSMLQNP